jgi:hypothetical protein
MIRDTSLEIYLKKVYPKLGNRQAVGLHFNRNAGGDHTNTEIASALSVPVSTITPRVLELRKVGLILDAGAPDVQGDGKYGASMAREASGVAACRKGECQEEYREEYREEEYGKLLLDQPLSLRHTTRRI